MTCMMRIEGVSQSVTDKIDTEDRQRDGRAGADPDPGFIDQDL